jgi:hypothetical protein
VNLLDELRWNLSINRQSKIVSIFRFQTHEYPMGTERAHPSLSLERIIEAGDGVRGMLIKKELR